MQDELLDLEVRMGKTMIFITHDFAEAIKLGDRIAIMKDGEFVQVDTPERVVLHPATPYVAEFTQDVPKSKVLTARTIMRAIEGRPLGGTPVAACATLDELIPVLASVDTALPVVDEDQTLVGCVDRRAIMEALSPNGGALVPAAEAL